MPHVKKKMRLLVKIKELNPSQSGSAGAKDKKNENESIPSL